MSELKALKSAIITSIVSVILCLAMLLGGTFAYFSSDVTGNVATIQTGYLSFNATYGDDPASGVIYTGESQLSFASTADPLQTLWAPGGIYALPAIYFTNLGNINCTVSYELYFTAVDVDLLKVINFTVNVDGTVCNLPDTVGQAVTATGIDGEQVSVALECYDSVDGNGNTVYDYKYTVTYSKVIAGHADAQSVAPDVRMQLTASMEDVTDTKYMNRTLASSITLKISADQISSQNP